MEKGGAEDGGEAPRAALRAGRDDILTELPFPGHEKVAVLAAHTNNHVWSSVAQRS